MTSSQHPSMKKTPIVQQVYKGLKVFGYYEASYKLLVGLTFLIIIAFLVISIFGRTDYIAYAAKVVSVEKVSGGYMATLEIHTDQGTQTITTKTSRHNIKPGDVMRVYVDPFDFSNVHEKKPSTINTIGYVIIFLALIVSVFMLVRFAIIISYPGLAATTPILQAIRKR